jgi:hypothetical protein
MGNDTIIDKEWAFITHHINRFIISNGNNRYKYVIIPVEDSETKPDQY